MFETYDFSESELQRDAEGSGRHVWSSVLLRTYKRWFYVSFSLRQSDGTDFESIYFTMNQEELVAMCGNDDFDILEANIVTPGDMNGTNGWQMDRITEIWSAIEADSIGTCTAYVYVIEGGNRYVDAPLGTHEDYLLHPKLVFKA